MGKWDLHHKHHDTRMNLAFAENDNDDDNNGAPGAEDLRKTEEDEKEMETKGGEDEDEDEEDDDDWVSSAGRGKALTAANLAAREKEREAQEQAEKKRLENDSDGERVGPGSDDDADTVWTWEHMSLSGGIAGRVRAPSIDVDEEVDVKVKSHYSRADTEQQRHHHHHHSSNSNSPGKRASQRRRSSMSGTDKASRRASLAEALSMLIDHGPDSSRSTKAAAALAARGEVPGRLRGLSRSRGDGDDDISVISADTYGTLQSSSSSHSHWTGATSMSSSTASSQASSRVLVWEGDDGARDEAEDDMEIQGRRGARQWRDDVDRWFESKLLPKEEQRGRAAGASAGAGAGAGAGGDTGGLEYSGHSDLTDDSYFDLPEIYGYAGAASSTGGGVTATPGAGDVVPMMLNPLASVSPTRYHSFRHSENGGEEEEEVPRRMQMKSIKELRPTQLRARVRPDPTNTSATRIDEEEDDDDQEGDFFDSPWGDASSEEGSDKSV